MSLDINSFKTFSETKKWIDEMIRTELLQYSVILSHNKDMSVFSSDSNNEIKANISNVTKLEFIFNRDLEFYYDQFLIILEFTRTADTDEESGNEGRVFTEMFEFSKRKSNMFFETIQNDNMMTINLHFSINVKTIKFVELKWECKCNER